MTWTKDNEDHPKFIMETLPAAAQINDLKGEPVFVIQLGVIYTKDFDAANVETLKNNLHQAVCDMLQKSLAPPPLAPGHC